MYKINIWTLLFLSVVSLVACGQAQKTKDKISPEKKEVHQFTNLLANETSPYLLQHAHNPVNWRAWNDETLALAKEENKPLLISIGYAACHWCHVMEKESFEDSVVAQIMNENFICIKVDREERPDVDKIYIEAVQMMTGSAGWPLNCFALPDGKPFFGGTYFPKKQWKNLLTRVANEYKTNPEKVQEFANKLTNGIAQNSLIEVQTESSAFNKGHLETAIKNISQVFDKKNGGSTGAPKFPMPNYLSFLLKYGYLNDDKNVQDHVALSLQKMAQGGLYDQIGGGFARYSTDDHWKAPHFEKMLYDNAQLVSLYSDAFKLTKNPMYARVVKETLTFIERELTSEYNSFYSSLDADSEGEEGKFYVWTTQELEHILGEDYDFAKGLYEIGSKSSWEKGNHILLRTNDEKKLVEKHGLTEQQFDKKVEQMQSKLLKARADRIRPGLDDKSLTSWNALMLSAYIDAYKAFGNAQYKEVAIKNAVFILEHQLRADGGLNHSFKDGKSTINGYLEDYALTIRAFIALYEITFEEKWLRQANTLCKYTIEHFYDAKSAMFHFTSDLDKVLITQKIEIYDNVIPSSNSVMAQSLFLLGHYFDNEDYFTKSRQMLRNVEQPMRDYLRGYGNWASLYLDHVFPFYEVAVSGKEAIKKTQTLNKHYLPNKMLVGSTVESELPLLEYKYDEGSTMIYVCQNKVCKFPVEDVEKAIEQITK